MLVSISKAVKNVCMIYILGNFPQWDYWMQMLWDGCMWKKNFPHAYKDSTISEAVGQKNFSLKKDEWCKIYLDKSHAYYYQIQAQIFIFAVENCDFVMWSTKISCATNSSWPRVLRKCSLCCHWVLQQVHFAWNCREVLHTRKVWGSSHFSFTNIIWWWRWGRVMVLLLARFGGQHIDWLW